jgi:hypothetical protein
MLSSSRRSALQYLVYTLAPKSVEEWAEARSCLPTTLAIDHLWVDLQVAYLLKSAAHPETIPTCLATIRLVQETNRGFIGELWTISYQARSIREKFHQIRQLYEIQEIQNKVPDGKISFPEDSRSLASGITVEFRYAPCSTNSFALLRH